MGSKVAGVRPVEGIGAPSVCPILDRIHPGRDYQPTQADRAAIETSDLEGTRNEARALTRTQIFLETLYPRAKLAAHPAGALTALKVAAVALSVSP